MSVPDHLIEKVAKAIHGPTWERRKSFYEAQDLPDMVMDERRRQARRALLAVADDLRAEGAAQERERIAREIEDMSDDAHRLGHDGEVLLSALPLAARVRSTTTGDTEQ